jgi:hypothetical protein
MQIYLGVILMMSLLGFQDVVAHPGGHGSPTVVAQCKKTGECTKDEISQAGLGLITQLVETGRISPSWGLIKTVNSIKKNNNEWAITFKNLKESNKSTQILYVFISNEGYLGGANFSGF